MIVGNTLLELIPQRFPMVLVDKLIQAEGNFTITGLTIRKDNLFIVNDRISASGVIENIAQTAACGLGMRNKQEGEKPKIGYIGSLKNVLIHKLPKVGEELTTKVTEINEVFGIKIVKGEVKIQEELIASCEMKIFISESE